MKFQYAPGLPGYGTQGTDGSNGLLGISLYFCYLNGDIDSPAINGKLYRNEILTDGNDKIPGYPTRLYQIGDMFVDVNGKVFKITAVSPSAAYVYTNSRLNTSTIFGETGDTVVTDPEYIRYSNGYVTDRFLIDSVFVSNAGAVGDYYASPVSGINGIYGIGAKDFAQIKYVDYDVSDYHPYLLFSNTNAPGEPERTIALVKENGKNHWRLGNLDGTGVVRDVSLSLDFVNVNIRKLSVNTVNSSSDININANLYTQTITPKINNSYNLGSDNNKFLQSHINTGYIETVNSSTGYIDLLYCDKINFHINDASIVGANGKTGASATVGGNLSISGGTGGGTLAGYGKTGGNTYIFGGAGGPGISGQGYGGDLYLSGGIGRTYGSIIMSGNVTIGGNLFAYSTGQDIGSSSTKFRNLWLDGSVNTESLNISSKGNFPRGSASAPTLVFDYNNDPDTGFGKFGNPALSGHISFSSNGVERLRFSGDNTTSSGIISTGSADTSLNLTAYGNIILNATGNIKYNTKTYYYSIPHTQFISETPYNDVIVYSKYYLTSSESVAVMAPINLPHGATIIGAVVKGSVSTDTWKLYKSDIASSGEDLTPSVNINTEFSLNVVVDNSKYAYGIQYNMTGGDVLYGAKIIYTMDTV